MSGTITREERKALRERLAKLPPETLERIVRTTPATEPFPTPYPWCVGAPTKEDCQRAGRCLRSPSCGD